MDGGGRGLEEMRRPGDQDDGCKARLANWAPLLFTSRAFEESAVSATRNVHPKRGRGERAAET